MNRLFSIEILEEINDVKLENIDIFVTLHKSKKRYTATFFTLNNIKQILEGYKETGECRNGMYFWASDMIITKDLSLKVINETITDLIETGAFELVFLEIKD